MKTSCGWQASRATGRWQATARKPSPRFGHRWAAPRSSAAVGRRRLFCRRHPDPSGHWRPADLRVRGHGLLRLGEAEQVVSMFRDTYNIPDPRRRIRPVPWRAGRRQRPRGESGRPSGASSSTCSRNTRTRSAGRSSWPRHALPRRHRIRLFQRRPSVTIKSHHNVGGLPEKMGLKSSNPARIVQGRGPRAGP